MSRKKSREADERAALGCVWGVGTWGILVAVAFVFEFLFNSSSGGAGSPGMSPIPIVAASAIFLGWIPAAIVGIRKFRQLNR